jgi:hypothetical protein
MVLIKRPKSFTKSRVYNRPNNNTVDFFLCIVITILEDYTIINILRVIYFSLKVN